MPRAHRYFLPNHVWHLTHRRHEKAFLLRFVRDRERYLHWLFEAKKRFSLRVLNYMVTSNHVHLLVGDTGEGVISRSMQLAAGAHRAGLQPAQGSRGCLLRGLAWSDPNTHAEDTPVTSSGGSEVKEYGYVQGRQVGVKAITSP